MRHHAELNAVMKTLDHYSVSKTIKRLIGVVAEFVCSCLFLLLIAFGIYLLFSPLLDSIYIKGRSHGAFDISIKVISDEFFRIFFLLLTFMLGCTFLFVALLLRKVRKRNALLSTAYLTVEEVVMEKEQLKKKDS